MMSRVIASVMVMCLLLTSSCVAQERTMTDSLRNELAISLAPGEASWTISMTNSLSPINNYILNVYINNGHNNDVGPSAIPNTVQEFWFNTGLFANATLVWSAYSSLYDVAGLQRNTTSNQYVGSSSQHNTAPGLYQFNFQIPIGGMLNTALSYRTQFGVTGYSSIQNVAILIVNPSNLLDYAETIVDDTYNNSIILTLENGVHSSSIVGSARLSDNDLHLSNYDLHVYIRNGEMFMVTKPEDVNPSTEEGWSLTGETFGATFGDATRVNTRYTYMQEGVLVTTYYPPNGAHSSFTNSFMVTLSFYIPPGGRLQAALAYTANQNWIQSTTNINVLFTNLSPAAAGVIGDPQFVGLRGQSYQIHGIDGAIYNIITESNMQVNARFAFLENGECPVFEGVPDVNCWSHPGSYLGEMSFQQIVDGKLHQLLVTSGPAKTGFAVIVLDGKALSVDDILSFGELRVSFTTTHTISIQTQKFSFELANSDRFINQAVSNRVPLSELNSHGLLGQTHAAKVYAGANRYIVGEVDDYVIAENEMFGTSFAYNMFHL